MWTLRPVIAAAVAAAIGLSMPSGVASLAFHGRRRAPLRTAALLGTRTGYNDECRSTEGRQSNRRQFIASWSSRTAAASFLATQIPTSPAEAASKDPKSDFRTYFAQIQKAREQLESVPKLIEAEKWDSVRAVLIEPPLADCWAKTNRPLLSRYAESLGDVGGDEFAALEAREELVGHLRYLDMAVYNNNFNPITVEGKSGATKELVRSYYEDPINEFKASKAALDELISLSKDVP